MNQVQTNNGRLVIHDPAWYESGANLPAVRSVIERTINDGRITAYEREVVFIHEPAPRRVAVRERSTGNGPEFLDCDGNPARPELVSKYYAGHYDVVDAAPDVPRQSWER